jgi:hypothetical protein
MWDLFSSAVRMNRSNLKLVATLSRARDVVSAIQKWVKHQTTRGSPGINGLLVLAKFNIIRALLVKIIVVI